MLNGDANKHEVRGAPLSLHVNYAKSLQKESRNHRNCTRNNLMLNALMVCLVEIMRFAPDESFVNERFNISRFDQDNAV